MLKVILKTGEEIICFHISIFMTNSLLIHTSQLTFLQAANIFTNPDALQEIIVESEDGNTVIYYGYQILKTIQRTPAIGPDALLIQLDR